MKQNHKTRRAFALSSIALTALALLSFSKDSTGVVRGQIQMKAAGVYEFSPGYAGSTHNIMVIDGTEVYRHEVGKDAVRKSFTFGQGKTCTGNRGLGWDLLPPGSKRLEEGGKVYAGYKENLVDLIKSLRKDYNAPNAPFVLAVGCRNPGRESFGLQIAEAQLAMNEAKKQK